MFRSRKKRDANFENNSWWIFEKSPLNSAIIDDPMKRGFLDNYGFFMALGGLYICFPGNWMISALHLSAAGTHVLLFLWTAYLSMDNMGDMCEALHFVVLLFSTSGMLISYLLQKSEIENIMRTLGEGVYDYDNTLDEDSLREMNMISANAKAAKKSYTKFFVSCVMVTLCSVSIIRPIAVILLQQVDYNGEFNGINKEIPIRCWYPFDTRGAVIKPLIFVLQYALIYSTPCAVFGFDLTFLYISEEIAAHLKCVGVTLRNVTIRAERLMKMRELDMDSSLSTCMNHCIQHHIAIVRLFKAFNDFYYYILLLMMTGAAMMLCLSCMLFTSNDVLTSSKITFFFFLMAELNHTFIFCWCGENIKQVSSDIGNEIYDCDWFNHSANLKIYAVMIIQKSIKPLTLKAGGFMDASMHTFSNVLSSAYSYFNLLNAVK